MSTLKDFLWSLLPSYVHAERKNWEQMLHLLQIYIFSCPCLSNIELPMQASQSVEYRHVYLRVMVWAPNRTGILKSISVCPEKLSLVWLSLRLKKMFFVSTNIAKKLGTVGFFFLFFKESYSFLYCKHVHFCYFYSYWLKQHVKHNYLDELSTKLQ